MHYIYGDALCVLHLMVVVVVLMAACDAGAATDPNFILDVEQKEPLASSHRV